MYLVLLRGSGPQNLGILNLENPNPKIFGNPFEFFALSKYDLWILTVFNISKM